MKPAPAVRILAAFLAARLAFGVYYVTSSVAGFTLPWYRPLERAWVIDAHPEGLAMDWFGRTAIALACAAMAGALVGVASARGAIAALLSRKAFVLGAARAVGLVVLLDFAYFGWSMLRIAPAPLPPCPR